MKIKDIPEISLVEIHPIPDGFSMTAEQIRKADFEEREFTDDEGKAYKRWIMTHEEMQFSVAKAVMRGFQTVLEEEAKSMRVKKTGEGLKTKYEIVIKE